MNQTINSSHDSREADGCKPNPGFLQWNRKTISSVLISAVAAVFLLNPIPAPPAFASLHTATKATNADVSALCTRMRPVVMIDYGGKMPELQDYDVLALCTGMRPVVMIDYGGKMLELQDRLLSLLELIQELHNDERYMFLFLQNSSTKACGTKF